MENSKTIMTKDNMADNIDAMENLMTVFDTELYVIEHILLNSGECWYYDCTTQTIKHGFLFIKATEIGDIVITFNQLGDNTSIILEPIEVYAFVNKNLEELQEDMGVL